MRKFAIPKTPVGRGLLDMDYQLRTANSDESSHTMRRRLTGSSLLDLAFGLRHSDGPMEPVTGLIFASLALMGSPGPATLSLAATGAAFGFGRGVPYLLGIIMGTTCVLLAIALGVTGLVLTVPGITPVLVTAAAAYILYLAYEIATAPPLSSESGDGAAPRFWNGLLLALANPKAYAAIGAVFSGFTLVENQPTADAVFKFGVLTCMIFIINSVWLGVGASLASLFRSPSASRAINIGFAVLLVISVIFSLFL